MKFLNKKSLKTSVLLCFVLLAALSHHASASTNDSSVEFHERLRAQLPPVNRGESNLSMIHMLPNDVLLQTAEADSSLTALHLAAQTSLVQVHDHTLQKTAGLSGSVPFSVGTAKPITLVIVPGIFGEFIPNRPFEEVLAKPSAERDAFVKKVSEARALGQPVAVDRAYSMAILGEEEKSLSDLVHVGSLLDDQGRVIARVVLLFTGFGSFESTGNLEQHAATFNRRLAKYLELTGPQDLALIGYSRGTTLALEMLSQAKTQSLPYLKDVKGLVSLGGVVWGSSLADDAGNARTNTGSLVQAIEELRNNVDPESVTGTLWAYTKFLWKAPSLAKTFSQHTLSPSTSDLRGNPITVGLDPRSLYALVKIFWAQLNLSSPIKGFADNVRRFQELVDRCIEGVETLTTQARQKWWATHEIPLGITYYELTAAMANPELSAFDLSSFDGKFGYSRRSYDDLSLLQNRLDYESIAGLTLNDSQVSVAQALFLPNAVAKSNPMNADMKTVYLGVLGTHHWGMALQVVNVMKDGRQNPFPRDALLRSLAIQLSLDAEGKNP